MAFPTAVNHQITDSVAQANLQVLGDAPAVGLSNLYIATSQALSNASHNAASNQQEANITLQAATTKGLSNIYAVDPGSTGIATKGILGLDRLCIPGLDVPTRGQGKLFHCCCRA